MCVRVEREREREKERKTYSQSDRQTDRQTDRQSSSTIPRSSSLASMWDEPGGTLTLLTWLRAAGSVWINGYPFVLLECDRFTLRYRNRGNIASLLSVDSVRSTNLACPPDVIGCQSFAKM
eukprot:2358696-Rhodomonas_salina.1